MLNLGGGGSAPSKYAPDLKPKFTSYLVQIRVGPIVMEKLSSWILKFCKEMLQQTWDEVVYFYLRFLRFFCSSEKLLQKVQLSHRRRVLLRVIEIQYFAKSLEGHWKSLEMEPFDRSHRSSYWRSIVSMTLSCHCRDKTRKWSKNRNFFSYPTCIRHSTPRCESPRRNIARKVWYGKLEWCGYRTVKIVWVYVYSFRSITRTWRTPDRRTDSARRHGHAYA